MDTDTPRGTDNQLDTYDIIHALDHFSDSDDDDHDPHHHPSPIALLYWAFHRLILFHQVIVQHSIYTIGIVFILVIRFWTASRNEWENAEMSQKKIGAFGRACFHQNSSKKKGELLLDDI